ncbi:MAG: ribosomal RNA small subunit methyltransferase A [Acidobacteria bacterium]|nr:ribosomal RNA small subunit methyltransferase A [Acidobacteriota bacterium]
MKKTFAKKSFGQNFLVDQNYISKIIAALNPKQGETIIEIGAGRGALTEMLIEKAGKVFAIELDRDLIPFLKEKFRGKENFELVESDALEINFAEIISNSESRIQNPESAKLIANLPYNISTAILQRLIEQKDCFSELILMFQREVVERITAKVGNSERGFLTVITEAYLTAEKLFDVPPTAFLPAPKVWSSVVRLLPKDEKIGDINLFREIVSAGFVQKRKTIFNNLKNKFGDVENVLQQCRIDSKRRAETLTIEEWKCLASSFEFRL